MPRARMNVARTRMAAPLGALALAVVLGATACSSSSSYAGKARLSSSDLSALVASTVSGGKHVFKMHATASVGGLSWNYYGAGALNYPKGSGSEYQVSSTGKKLLVTQSPPQTQVPILSMVFTRPAVYWEGWGSVGQAISQMKKSWISISQQDTTSIPGGSQNLFLATTTTDPYIYLDLLSSGTATAKFVRSSSIAGNSDRLYEASVNGPNASSAVPGLESGLVHLLGSAAGQSTLALQVWIAGNGTIDQIEFATTGGTGSAKGHLPRVTATLSFVGSGVPTAAGIASPPPAATTVDISALLQQGSSSSQAPGSSPPGSGSTSTSVPETCAEDKADGGHDAAACPGSTTAPPGGAPTSSTPG